MKNFHKNILDETKRVLQYFNAKSHASNNDLSFKKKVIKKSQFVNIYHCCTQKTASQWFVSVFSDPRVYKYTGLDISLFTDWRKDVIEKCFDNNIPLLEVSANLYNGHYISLPLPEWTIGVPLYIGYKTYESIPKPLSYRTFFVLRDPRDIVVSWYFSTLYSHPSTGAIPKFRSDLKKMSLKEGLMYSIKSIREFGLFAGQRAWMENYEKDENVKIFRYEELSQDNRRFLKELFAYLNINMPEEEFDAFYRQHIFEAYSKGRPRGSEDLKSHYRKGEAGDWKNHFNTSIVSYFRQVTEDLIEVLGYQ